MPRKTSQRNAAIADAKNEGNAPRRSGRAVTKQETSTEKASRSRRSSTAAQTAASVADSKTPKTKGSSRRESTSPSDTRTKETPATRAKSTRRSTGRINYKESDGEEEVPPVTKYDDNFESGDELEESDSDERSKTRGRSRASKTPTKGREASKAKSTSRTRRGRPSKKKGQEDEESETFDVSDDSVEPEDVPVKKGRAVKEKEPSKPVRSRRQRAEVIEVKSKPAAEDKARPSRRSGRAASNKAESPKKRPSRAVQAKRYAEDYDDDDIEEISDTKGDGDEAPEKKPTEGRKRKRGASPEEANKRLKDEDSEPTEEGKEEVAEEDVKDDSVEEKVPEEKSVEEPMEVDESNEAKSEKEEVKVETKLESKTEDVVDKTEKETTESKMEEDTVSLKEKPADLNKQDSVESSENDESMQSSASEPKEESKGPWLSSLKSTLSSMDDSKDILKKEKPVESNKQDSVESSENDESMQSSESEPKAESKGPWLSGLKLSSSQDIRETGKDTAVKPKTEDEKKVDQPKVEVTPPSTESSQLVVEKSEKRESLPPPQPPVVSEAKPEKVESPPETLVKRDGETFKNDSYVSGVTFSPPLVATPALTPVTITPPKEPKADSALNGAEQSGSVQNSVNEVHSTSTATANFDHMDKTAPKANGAHNDVQHTNSSPKEQYYSLPGRKYVTNSKLNENLRQSIKNHTFGFVSYNLGTPNSDAYLQKEKLLNELNSLDAHVICLQQVAKPFYDAVLEPSLDALGFKSVFSQPQDSLKGMATFYKSSLFRLSGKSDISIKELVEKGIAASSLSPTDKAAVKSHIRRCGSVLFTHFSTVVGTQTITVANIQIPRTDLSSHALQVSCLAQEFFRINEGTNKPLLLAGEFNIAENDASYQLLRDGYLNNEMIEELQRRKDVVLPEKENASLVNLLWNCFQHPSSNLCSCYHSVLDHEFFIPELKTSSPDLLWYSSGSLHTVGVLDAVSDKPGDHHLSLKADVAFSV